MRALFVGGTVDNSELDLEGTAPVNYPSETGSGHARYRLFELGQRDGQPVYAVYAAANLADDHIERVIAERGYVRRFGAEAREQRDRAGSPSSR